MKTVFKIFIFILLTADISAQTCPTTIRVGTSCSCHSCSGTIDVLSYETYVKRVLPQEWFNCWGSLSGGMNSLQAGAVAIRSYTIPRMASYISSHNSGAYDICSTTCCHVYGTTQYTNSNNAVDNTANYVLVSGSTIQLSEYAAEQNNHPSCGNGYKGNGTGSWPCTTDGPCTGKTYNGHGRGACQWGTARWATGDVLSSGGCSLASSHGYGTKTWQQILSHYYPNWTLTTCGVTPTHTYDNPCDAGVPTLTVNTSCNYGVNRTIVGATKSSQITDASCDQPSNVDVWFKFTIPSGVFGIHTNSISISGNDCGLAIYTGSCSSMTERTCIIGGNPSQGYMPWSDNINLNAYAGQTAYIRVWEFGSVSQVGEFQICVFSSCTVPTQPGSISGSTSVCQSSSQTYSIGSVSGATSYTWSYSGSPSPSGTGTSITFSPTSSGTLSVTANNSCGSSTARTLSITVNPKPSQPSSISGSTSVCQNSSQTYSIPAVSGATSYTWSYSGSPSPSGTGTSITFSPTSSGTLSVTANNSCGSSTARTLSITVNPKPSQPSSISGSTSVCQNSSQTYSIPAVSGATNYTWSYSGSPSPSGTGTSITFNPTSSGTLSVTANNNCGSSTARTLSITVTPIPAQPGNISGPTEVCQGTPGGFMYSVSPVSGAASYTWTKPPGFSGSSSTNSITITAGSTSGNVCVTANNTCGSSTQRCLPVTVNGICVGINGAPNETLFSIFPNPTKDQFTITFGKVIHNALIEIFNPLGQLVYQQQFKNISNGDSQIISLNVAEGVYSVKVGDGEKQYTQKLIIQ